MPKLTAIRKQAVDEMMRGVIFEAAMTVFAEQGVEGMTMDRLAVAANIAKGSLYHYFPGKKALLEFMHAKVIDPLIQDLEEIVATQQTAIEKLTVHVNHLLEHIARHVQVFRLLFQDDTAQGLLQTSQRRTREVGGRYLAEIFRQGIAEGTFRLEDPDMLTQVFLGLCRGILDTQSELESHDQREKIRSLIMSVLLGGVATEDCRRTYLPQ